MRTTPASVAAPADGLASAELGGERLLWRDGHLRCLDRVASTIWPHFDGEAPLSEVAAAVAAAFDRPPEPVARDIAALLDALWEEGYVSLDGETRTSDGSSTMDERPVIGFGSGPAPPAGADRDDLPWVLESGRYRALEHDFAVRTTDPSVAAYIEPRLTALLAPGRPAHTYSVIAAEDAGQQRYDTYFDGTGLLSTPSLDLALRHLLWHINQQVMRSDGNHLLVHASAAVTDDGTGIVLPGSMNAGKSTLVAALVRRGYAYLTDEMAAIDPATGRIAPYPRPVNLGRASWALLPDLQPPDWSPTAPIPADLWHVDPRTIGRLGEPCDVAHVVAPRYEHGVPPTLLPVSPAEGAELLYHHAFNAHALGEHGFEAAVAAAKGSSCARLISGDLEGSVAAILRFVQNAGSGPHAA